MRRALNSAAGLTNRLLAFSRRQPLSPKPIEPDRFIAGMEELSAAHARAGDRG